MALLLSGSAGLLVFPSQTFLQRATRWKHFPKTPAMIWERGDKLSWGDKGS